MRLASFSTHQDVSPTSLIKVLNMRQSLSCSTIFFEPLHVAPVPPTMLHIAFMKIDRFVTSTNRAIPGGCFECVLQGCSLQSVFGIKARINKNKPSHQPHEREAHHFRDKTKLGTLSRNKCSGVSCQVPRLPVEANNLIRIQKRVRHTPTYALSRISIFIT